MRAPSSPCAGGEAIAQKRFREDLYYRLRVLEARIPSLAERPEDVIPLAVHFCRVACARHELESVRLSPAALRILRTTDWPGNVRELENRVESAVLHAHLRRSAAVEARDLAISGGQPVDDVVTLQEATRRFQKRHVQSVLDSTDWNVADLRGRFVRGLGEGIAGEGRDPDQTRVLGSLQADGTALPEVPFTTDTQGSHAHGSPAQIQVNGIDTIHESTDSSPGEVNIRHPGGGLGADGAHAHTVTGGGDAETRPANIALVYAIHVGLAP